MTLIVKKFSVLRKHVYTPVVSQKHRIDSSHWSRHNPCVGKTLPGKLSPCDVSETYGVSRLCQSSLRRPSSVKHQCVDTVFHLQKRQQVDSTSSDNNTSLADFQCRAGVAYWHTKNPSTPSKMKRFWKTRATPRSVRG